MTDSAPIAPSPNRLRRGRAMLALLTATAALSGGAQALSPMPAAAMINLGDCANLSGPALFECEMRGAGAGGGSGGTAGGSNNTTSGEEETIGEVIRIHDTPPSECMLPPRTCLPSTPGGRHQISSDGVRPRGPRPGHRPVRVGEVAKGKLTKGKAKPTKKECASAATNLASLKESFEQRERRRWDLFSNWHTANDSRNDLWGDEANLTHELNDLRAKPSSSHDQVVALEAQLAEVKQRIAAIDREIDSIDRQLDAIKGEVDALISKLGVQSKLVEECDRLYPPRSQA
jgi:hypothetical protein